MKVKICGITNREDALNAISLGASALGFIFTPNSPRYVSPDVVREISLYVPPFVSMVGVFVNQDKAEIDELVNQCKLDLIQLHGDETHDFVLQMKRRVIKALRVSSVEDLDAIPKYQGIASAILLDTKVAGSYGGTGQTFDWGLALQAKEYDIPLILSGGIGPENVLKAHSLVDPFAVDLSSGVESEPGIKDYSKMQALFSELREC